MTSSVYGLYQLYPITLHDVSRTHEEAATSSIPPFLALVGPEHQSLAGCSPFLLPPGRGAGGESQSQYTLTLIRFKNTRLWWISGSRELCCTKLP